jgi:CubicO group peptidase (beta-lactamase class C family)
LLVARGGELVLEWYDQPSTAHERLLGLSISKPVVSLLLAQAVAAGAVTNLDAPVTRYLPDLANRDARWSDVSLRALDDMRAVLAGPGDRDAPVSVAAQLYVSRDLDRHLRKLRPEPSGANQLNYHSGATQLVATAIEAAAGQRIEHLLAAGVWQPIGAEALATWGRDRADGGRAKAFCCLAAVPRDWLRLGQQFVVPAGDASVVPAQLRDRIRDASQSDRYRAGWWVQPSIRSPAGSQRQRACLASSARRAAVGWLGQTLLIDLDQGWVALRIGEAGDWRHWPLLTTILACDVLSASPSANSPPLP